MDAIHLPAGITLPTTFGAPGTPLPPGNVVQALVLELIESDVFRLQLPQAVVDVRSNIRLTPGDTITLAVKSGGAHTQFVIYSDSTEAPAPGQAAAPSVAGRQPIGEAVIVARVTAAGKAPAPVQGRAPEVAVARDAPSISPARTAPLAPGRPDAPSPTPAATPERALSEAIRVAAARQSSLAPLIADVEQVVRTAAAAVPAPVRAAAQQLLALRVPLDQALTAADVRQAFARSGVLFEPRLAADLAPGSDAHAVAPHGASRPAPTGDLKAALLVFREVLKAWTGNTAPLRVQPAQVIQPAPTSSAPDQVPAPRQALPIAGDGIKQLANVLAQAAESIVPSASPMTPEQATALAKDVAGALQPHDPAAAHPAPAVPNNAPPPPYRGAPLAAQAPTGPSIMPGTTPHEAAERLLAQTDGAIARTTLLQAASLPDQPAAGTPHTDPAAQRWTFEVPFATPQGTGIAQFEVSRDGRSPRQEVNTPLWRARFSLDVEPMGPVHALVAIAGERASVTLWAERLSTATRLNDHAPLLSEALRAAELAPADFLFRVGAPPAVRHAATPGRFMDRAS